MMQLSSAADVVAGVCALAKEEAPIAIAPNSSADLTFIFFTFWVRCVEERNLPGRSDSLVASW
jgi:hypothetical protein